EVLLAEEHHSLKALGLGGLDKPFGKRVQIGTPRREDLVSRHCRAAGAGRPRCRAGLGPGGRAEAKKSPRTCCRSGTCLDLATEETAHPISGPAGGRPERRSDSLLPTDSGRTNSETSGPARNLASSSWFDQIESLNHFLPDFSEEIDDKLTS